MKTNPDEPIRVNHGAWNDEMNKIHGGRGLTKREYFAAMALVGSATSLFSGNSSLAPDAVQTAVIIADALIEELNKENNSAS